MRFHSEGSDEMKRYCVKNRITQESATMDAPSAAEACALCGWLIGDCFVREVRK